MISSNLQLFYHFPSTYGRDDMNDKKFFLNFLNFSGENHPEAF